MDATTKIHIQFANVIKKDKCAIVPINYISGVCEVLRDEHLNPNGGAIVSNNRNVVTGQHIYIN
ncbi:MAG: hypothetical protein MJZ30_11435 [Paludibacteraceae bacterium]|nr:hypothetical protein [Paludibacteraceae bacterium]